MEKRDFLKTGAIAGLGTILAGNTLFAANQGFNTNKNDALTDSTGKYVLPPLAYEYNALEPYIDEQTMRLHHSKHHQGYVNGLNKATDKVKEAISSDDYSLIKHWERELAFHGSGHFLHTIFWNIMGPSQGKMSNELKQRIDKSFGSFDNFKKLFFNASKSVEGSGWGILAYQPDTDMLTVLQAEKHHNLTQWISIPILVIDVWEHAYYLKYQNKRGDYINAFFEVINWDAVSERLDNLITK
jgi:Fe-Mn family superoxide dismutase